MDSHDTDARQPVHGQARIGLDEADLCALRQLDDTRYLAVGTLDDTRCQRLERLGFAIGDSQGYWKISPAGRRLIR